MNFSPLPSTSDSAPDLTTMIFNYTFTNRQTLLYILFLINNLTDFTADFHRQKVRF